MLMLARQPEDRVSAGVRCLKYLQLRPLLLQLQAAQQGLQAAQAGLLLPALQLLQCCHWALELLLEGPGC